jgi:SlyX protein
MSSERIDRLEERLAWLERHVEEQDKVVLALSDTVDRLRAEVRLLRDRTSSGQGGAGDFTPSTDDRPPHY